jgi:hypothetical protein
MESLIYFYSFFSITTTVLYAFYHLLLHDSVGYSLYGLTNNLYMRFLLLNTATSFFFTAATLLKRFVFGDLRLIELEVILLLTLRPL